MSAYDPSCSKSIILHLGPKFEADISVRYFLKPRLIKEINPEQIQDSLFGGLSFFPRYD